MNQEPLELYGAPVGLYTGKIRCYLRKQGIAYREHLPTARAFRKEILPAIGRFMNPVIRTPDGTVVQDSTDIIRFCEDHRLARHPAVPATPRQRLTALALDLYGGEGLTRAAMHYRWSFPAENLAFLRHEFGLAYRAIGMAQADAEAALDAFTAYLAEYLPRLGILPSTKAAVEDAYLEFLSVLDLHLREHPYMLGGAPTCADYGMVATLWAHLGRDPHPSMLMKQRAPSVYRWVERMNAADDDMPEFPRAEARLPDDDEVPATLVPVLASMARDYLPELVAAVAATDAWLASQPGVAAGQPCTADPSQRAVADAAFTLRGRPVVSMAPVYTLWMLQRVTDAWKELDPGARGPVRALFDQAGLAPLLELEASRRVERHNHLERWGEATGSR